MTGFHSEGQWQQIFKVRAQQVSFKATVAPTEFVHHSVGSHCSPGSIGRKVYQICVARF